MKSKFIFFGFLLLTAWSCFNPPDFPTTPKIAIDKVSIIQVPGANTPDTLSVAINFQDGDGNIGLDGNEFTPPYNEQWFFLTSPSPTCEQGIKAPCTKISYVDTVNMAKYITYSLRRTNPNYDTLPEFTKPYDCLNYHVIKRANGKVKDTVYTQFNKRYNNIFVDILVKSGTGSYKYEFNSQAYPKCDIYGLDGRLPILAKDNLVDSKLPLEGVITYKIVSASFYQNLKNKTLSLRIWIMDRDGNASNVDISNEFTLN